MELTVVMPCLNEAETVATCVAKAVGFLPAQSWYQDFTQVTVK